MQLLSAFRKPYAHPAREHIVRQQVKQRGV
jgi:hypothetical protein